MSNAILQMHAGDSVGVALKALMPGDQLTDALACREEVPAGHKVSLRDVAAGDALYKYGQMIGVASQEILAGSHVHVHNLQYVEVAANAGAAAHADADTTDNAPQSAGTFDGYIRPDGQVGTRNYIGVMATVNCSATVVARIARHFDSHPALRCASVDGVVPLTHQTGCGIAAGEGVDLNVLRRVLSGYLKNPNFYGWVVVGLGCEVNQADGLLDEIDDRLRAGIRTVGIQDAGGTSAAIEEGVAAVEALLQGAARVERQPAPLSALKVGLQCGGSDGWSGITANPALGAAVDRVVANGGSAILAETPEIYGAEQLLYNRAASPEIAAELQSKVDWWQDYLARHGQDMNNNPSPGNLAGGITTILEKSLGAVAKSGTSPLNRVLSYAEPSAVGGLLFMDSPGYDPCSVTGEIAAGANLICFTTGRGSTFGAAGAPTLKLASNHQLYSRMSEDMDIDCGAIASGELDIGAVGEEIFRRIVETASGKMTSSEQLGLGEYEFVPWSLGATV